MISVYPSFYKDFRCKADRCVHSCCMQNWDIDIDEATAMKYLVMTGEPGETIRASMTGTKGNRRFIMKDGRCPLLQEDGLCRIVAETGEENLCDICAMHPRFFVENGNFELAGVGLACEESVKLLLSNSTPLLSWKTAPFLYSTFPRCFPLWAAVFPKKRSPIRRPSMKLTAGPFYTLFLKRNLSMKHGQRGSPLFPDFYFHAEKGARLSFRSASPGIDGGVSIHFLPRPGKRTVLRHRRRHDIRPAKHRLHLHGNCRIRKSP